MAGPSSTSRRPVFLVLLLLLPTCLLLLNLAPRASSFQLAPPSQPSRSRGLTNMFFWGGGGKKEASSSPATTPAAISNAKLSPLPKGEDVYEDIRAQSVAACQAAIKAGVKQIEVDFPVSRNRIDVSLGEFLDESRAFAREFIRSFSAKYGNKLWIVFPDGKEATLAVKKWGQGTFRVMGLQKAIGLSDPVELQIVITPGFNMDEYLNLEKLYRGVPMIVINGNLDRVRSSYYPRIFYPGLYDAKERFIKNFDPAYYIKPLPGGYIFRVFPEPWQQVYSYVTPGPKDKRKVINEVLATTTDKPDYNTVAETLKFRSMQSPN